LIVLPTAINGAHRERIISLAARLRLPAIYPFRNYGTDGGLICYGFDTIDLWRRGASYVDRILKGEKPADLPVQAPTKYELVINLRTAKAMGLEVPPALLARAASGSFGLVNRAMVPALGMSSTSSPNPLPLSSVPKKLTPVMLPAGTVEAGDEAGKKGRHRN
jgi:hypothetical protein